MPEEHSDTSSLEYLNELVYFPESLGVDKPSVTTGLELAGLPSLDVFGKALRNVCGLGHDEDMVKTGVRWG